MKLAREIWGEGAQPALLLHGFTGSARSWDHLRSHLGPYLRAIAVDLPGHGASSHCEGFAQTLDDLRQLLDELRLGQVDMIGYSLGARLALAFALQYPTRVRRLVLESPNPGLRQPKERADRRREDLLLAQEIEAGGIVAFVERWEALPLFAGLRRLPPNLANELRARRLSCSTQGLASALRGLSLGVQPNHWSLLPTLRVPTLAIAGAEDEKFSKIARAMASQLPLGWTKILEDCGHAPHLEQPAAYVREVLSFLSTPWFETSLPEDSTWMDA